jgi:DNA-binding NtrC family response regulator
MPRVLVVEDRDSLRRLLERALRQEGYEVVVAGDGREGIRLLRQGGCDLVLTDLKLPGADGLEVLRAARDASPPPPVVVMTAHGSVAAAVEAMKLGAVDFLEKPVEIEDLFRLLRRVAGGAPAEASFAPPGAPPIIGRHPRLRAALRLLERVAPTESTVLLTGESGTGKELFARALHALSPRRDGPFVAVNCAAIPEALIENELFGHQRGAYTGADRRSDGRFAAAQGGTLLLDEVGELPLAVQAKVLRVLEERTYERVGGGPTLRADVRLVAATNRDLRAMVAEGSFRTDLFFRLEVFPVEIPPLRERAEDVPLLAEHLLREAARRHGRPAPVLDPKALELLAAQPWPGNVRELAHVLERATVLCEGSLLRAADLAPLLQPLAGGGERERLRQALAEAGGDKRRAAELLGVSYRTLLRRVKEHDLEGYPRYRD